MFEYVHGLFVYTKATGLGYELMCNSCALIPGFDFCYTFFLGADVGSAVEDSDGNRLRFVASGLIVFL